MHVFFTGDWRVAKMVILTSEITCHLSELTDH